MSTQQIGWCNFITQMADTVEHDISGFHFVSFLPPPNSAPVATAVELAAAMLYEHRLDNLGRLFDAKGVHALIVKGQAIVDLAYSGDKVRLAGDVDLLVGDDEERICSCLQQLGYHERKAPGRRFSHRLLGERPFVTKNSELPGLIEIHRFLDKAILRPVDYAGIRSRSRPSKRKGFLYPSSEDLILLLVLHESVALVPSVARTKQDLRMLMTNAHPNMEVVMDRARAWQLERALVDLLSDGQSGDGPVPAAGFPYLLAQRSRHDSNLTWARGMLRYGALRVLDRLL